MYGLFSLNALHWFNQEYFTIPHHVCVSVCGLDVYFGGAAHSECKDFNLTHSSCTYSVDFAVSYAIRKWLASFSSTVKKEAMRRPMHTFMYSCLTCSEYSWLLLQFFLSAVRYYPCKCFSIEQHTYNNLFYCTVGNIFFSVVYCYFQFCLFHFHVTIMPVMMEWPGSHKNCGNTLQ